MNYSLSYEKNRIGETDSNLISIIYLLYENLLIMRNIDLYRVVVCYHNIILNEWGVSYHGGLCLKNRDTTLKITDLFPIFECLDKKLIPLFRNKKKIPRVLKFPKSGVKPIQEHVPEKQYEMEKTEILEETGQKMQTRVESVGDETGKRLNFKEKNGYNIHKFQEDKNIYLQLKDVVDKGEMDPEMIHDIFICKYVIFQLLEYRGDINFENNENVEREYSIFYDHLQKIEDEEKIFIL